MKTAENWIATFADCDSVKTYFGLTPKDIRAVQADALKHAAQLASLNWEPDYLAKKLNEQADQLER